MAEIWYIGIKEEDIEGKSPVYEIPLKKLLKIFDLRPNSRVCSLEEFPQLKTGNPIIDESGYVYVLIRITEEEIEESGEGSYREGWYKSPHTIVMTEKILKKPDEE